MTKPNPQEPGSAYLHAEIDAMLKLTDSARGPNPEKHAKISATIQAECIARAKRADTEIAALARKLEEEKAALEKYATAWGANDAGEAALAWEADGYGAHARRALAQMEQG